MAIVRATPEGPAPKGETKMIATAARIARQLLAAAATRVLTAIQPAPVEAIPAPAKESKAKPLFTPGEMPTVADIEAHGDVHQAAADAKRAGGRGIYRAEKLLSRLPDGVYGRVTVAREESNRLVADLDAIAAILREHGLGEIPMRRCAPTLRITVAHAVAAPALVAVAA